MLSSVLTSITFAVVFQIFRLPQEQSASPRDEARNTTGCLQQFNSNPNHFEQCKTKVCFLFVTAKPFVFLDPRMEAENNQTLFRCNGRASIFPGLRGISFRIKEKLLLDDALCVFAGTQCTFNNMVDFVAEHSTASGGHQFTIAGLMFILPSRISRRTTPSVPIVEGKLVILGPRDPSSRNSGVRSILLQPFERNAWIMLGVVLTFLIALSLLIFRTFSEKYTCSNYVRSLLGELNNVLETVEAHTPVNYIFVQQTKELDKDVRSLTSRDLSKYMVMADAAQEVVWRKIVDPSGRYDNGSFPWRECGAIDDCYEKLLDKNHPADYLVTYDLDIRYHLQNQTLCDRFTVYSTKRPMFSFNWGWYYGANVPLDTRIRIDRAISTLRLEDEMRAIFAEELDTSDSFHCRKTSQSIGVHIVGPMIAVFVGIFVLLLLAAVVRGCQIRKKLTLGYPVRQQLGMSPTPRTRS